MRKSSIAKPESAFNILPPGFNPFLMQTTSKSDLIPAGSRPFNMIGWNSLIPPELSLSRPAWMVQNFPMYFPFFQFPQMLNDNRCRSGLKDNYQHDRKVAEVIVNPRDTANCVSPADGTNRSTSYTATDRLSPYRLSPSGYMSNFDSNHQNKIKNSNQVEIRTVSSSHDNDTDNRQSPTDENSDLNAVGKVFEPETPYLKFGVRAILSGQLDNNKQNPSPTRANHEPPFRFPNHVTSPVSGEFRNPYFNHHYQLLNHSNHRPHCTGRIGSHGNLYSGITSPILPWLPTSIRGKNRRGMLRRAVFTDTQRKSLEKKFQCQKYIGKPDRKRLAAKLGLKDSQVKIWFQNRRMKWRNSKEREMLQAVRNDVTTDESVTSSVSTTNSKTDDVIMQKSQTDNAVL